MPAGRPRFTIRPIQKNIHIPEDIAARIDLQLFSEAEGCVPRGAWQKLFLELVLPWLKEKEKVYGVAAANNE